VAFLRFEQYFHDGCPYSDRPDEPPDFLSKCGDIFRFSGEVVGTRSQMAFSALDRC
jgi:hypothetical protein